MLNPNLFNTYLVFPILNLLILFYKVFLFIKLPGAFGFAIVALTASVRLLFQPFFKKQMDTAAKMQELKPHLDRLGEKHKNDKKALQQEQMKLYQQAGINPASGCLFMIIQIPVFIALYNTLSLFFTNGNLAKVITQINNVLYAPFLKITSIDPWFFGFNLAVTPKQSGAWYYLLIPIVTGLLQYFQAVSMTPPTSSIVNKTSEVKSDAGDFQKAMSTQMKYLFPVMIGWFSYTLPVGLSLYWNIFSLFSIIQGKKLKVDPNKQIQGNDK
ncbi:MAG: Membrane protein insertase, YidC/Oxa1 family [Candidatus Roizmanbacteria bacterium GW2011_GWC2_37_13]|uniref:Membrane protein insertase, YidC/Oxa1 family n=1 Tax=Candidatus Roizmanbacteria bacterium GW2011_GWC2_37_13 TaxID=1618486 RepID=A0A0G0J8S3_9BACT|nr:MAG: Membrane protein insertase, YidC/Oxa1 family [Candidatus Roizmanbacteria bacterium GW2011_GWC1_37_12]KKQ24446.1 MAG: Membrane protein insertase, YidC/Oxa1 family [Candidatus Roizmanbacteria bacterium GW2011_GWC2_37_13]